MGEIKKASPIRYGGPERRRHRMFVTRNTEYHFRDGVCVAVRDRRTGEWLAGHLAIRRPVYGGIRFCLNGAMLPNPGEPRVGECMFFVAGGRDLVTSTVVAVDRPPKPLVAQYPSN